MAMVTCRGDLALLLGLFVASGAINCRGRGGQSGKQYESISITPKQSIDHQTFTQSDERGGRGEFVLLGKSI